MAWHWDEVAVAGALADHVGPARAAAAASYSLLLTLGTHSATARLARHSLLPSLHLTAQ